MKNTTPGFRTRSPFKSSPGAIWLMKLFPLLLLSVFLAFSHIAVANDQVNPTVSSEVQPGPASDMAAQHASYDAVFKQAVADDLAGKPQSARKGYDVLQGTEYDAQIATPSAVNLAVLGQFDAAKKAFHKIAAGPATQEAQYASLWQLWLTARTWTGSPAALQKQLAKAAANYRFTFPRYQAIANLYAGKGSPEAIFSAVKAMPDTRLLAKGDAYTEATFFTGGYLQYATQNNNAALQLYEREQVHLNNTSLEKPLIDTATAALLATNHKS